MATAVLIPGTGSWTRRDSHKTTWNNLEINTTGDAGSVQGAYGGMSLISVYVTGTMTSVSVLEFQESQIEAGTFAVGQTVCGTNLSFDGATGTGLSTGTVYMMRPGASFYRPKITAGVSGAEDLTVIFVQSNPSA